LKIAVIYDSVSPQRVTAKVADVVVETLKTNGAEVDVFFIDDAGKAKLDDYDCVVLGAPTMAWRPSQKMKQYLSGIQGKRVAGKSAASFDTQLKSAVSGNATKHMDRALEDMGFKIVVSDLIAYVESENKAYRLKEGEADKAKKWAEDLAKALK